MGDLRTLQHTWDSLAREDALGVILSYPLRRDDWKLEEFLETGRREIDAVLEDGRQFGLPSGWDAALDFGCGVGRLTQAMAERFERCDGVDIAPSMIELARELNRHRERCRYHLNESDALPMFGDGEFDFVYSNITLQHIEPRFSRRYVAELVRVLRRGGLLVFQLPSDRESLPKLPRNAVLAEIDVPAELALQAGREARVPVRVRNAGATRWPSALGHGQINVGNHWRDRDGKLLALDDGREPLPHDVEPGATADVELTVRAPHQPGEYVLELDLVQEGVAWFAQRRRFSRRRSQPARVPVRVAESADEDARPAPEGWPRMDMYGVPRRDVEEVVERAGGRVLDVVRNDAAGPGWISLRYTVSKP